MDLLKDFILIIVAIVAVIVLIAISSNLLKFDQHPTEFTFQGSKQQVLNGILGLIYKCYDNNQGKKTSNLCFQVHVNSTEAITSSDIKNGIDHRGLNSTQIIVPDILQENNTVIRYEDEIVYLEVIQGERVGS